MQIKEMKVADLIPYENNPRVNSDAIDKVAESIRQFGFQNPIVIDEENIILAGHTRLEAAKKLGLEEVPTIQAKDLTEDQLREFRIIDNKSSEFATWNFSRLKEELEEIHGIDMNEFGFMVEEIKGLKETAAEQVEETEERVIRCPRCGKIVAMGGRR